MDKAGANDFDRSSLVTVARVYGAEAYAVTMAQLGGAGIPAAADVRHFTSTQPNMFVAVGGMSIAVPRSKAKEAHDLLASSEWHARGMSKLQAVLWVAIMLWVFVPPNPTAVFVMRFNAADLATKRS